MKNEILNHFGSKKQIIKLIEEMSELTKVLCEWLICDIVDNRFKERLIEEFSDVLNMLDYLPLIFAISKEELKENMLERDIRTMIRIKEGYYK